MGAIRFRSDIRGASAPEYVLAVALVSLAAVAGWTALGDAVRDEITCAASALGGGGARCARGTPAADSAAHADRPWDGPATVAGVAPPDTHERALALARSLVTPPRGTSTAAQRDALVESVARMPLPILSHLSEQGTRIVVANGDVADVLPDLAHSRPRGWEPGATFEDVHGAYVPQTNEVVVSVGASGHVSLGLLAHEVGHALDYHGGGTALESGRGAFDAAYADTVPRLRRAGEQYFLQPHGDGREEIFAESLSLLLTSPAELQRRWPALYAHWSRDPAGMLSSGAVWVASYIAAPAGAGPAPNPIGWVDDHIVEPARRHVVEPVQHHVIEPVSGAARKAGAVVLSSPEIVARATQRIEWLTSPLPPLDPRQWRSWIEFRANMVVGVGQATSEMATGVAALLAPPGMLEPIDWRQALAAMSAAPGALAEQVRTCAVGSARDAGRACGQLSTMAVPGGAVLKGTRIAGSLAKGGAVAPGRVTTRVGRSRERGGRSRGAPVPIDAATRDILTSYGLTEESRLYRWTEREYLGADGTISGNPRTVAVVADTDHLVPHPMLEQAQRLEMEASWPASVPKYVPAAAPARTLGPTLNVSVKRSDVYGRGRTLISVRVGDVLAAGGRLYRDIDATAGQVRPLVVTVPRPIPFRFEPAE